MIRRNVEFKQGVRGGNAEALLGCFPHRRGKNQMYRCYLNDPVIFQKSIRVTIEHGHNNNFENDYTSTAFWYQEDPHKAFPPMPAAKDRLPTWPEGVALAIDKESEPRRQIASPLSAGNIQADKEGSANGNN